MRFVTPTQEQEAGWNEFVAGLPVDCREMVEKYRLDPWTVYRIRPSGHRGGIVSIDENKNGPPTLKLTVDGERNLVAFSRTVFGIKPEDLEECDLPGPDEPVGDMQIPLDVVREAIGSHRGPKGDA